MAKKSPNSPSRPSGKKKQNSNLPQPKEEIVVDPDAPLPVEKDTGEGK